MLALMQSIIKMYFRLICFDLAMYNYLVGLVLMYTCSVVLSTDVHKLQ